MKNTYTKPLSCVINLHFESAMLSNSTEIKIDPDSGITDQRAMQRDFSWTGDDDNDE